MDYSTLTYETTATGYRIYCGGALWIDQPFDPSRPGRQAYAPEDAAAAAQALIAELQAAQAAQAGQGGGDAPAVEP